MTEKKELRIIVAGPRGRMGSETIRMIEKAPDLTLVAAVDHGHDGARVSELVPGAEEASAKIYTDIDACFSNEQADVLIDFTNPESGKRNLQKAIDYGVRPVIGTSGFSNDEVAAYRAQMDQKKLGGIIAPNFAIGAVLVMKFSQMAAKYFPDAEIIELHHDKKKDAPSGTAVKTAELMTKTRQAKKQGAADEKETLPGARGADYEGMRIHSVRLPGLIAHQEVLFGGKGELLTLRHDSMDRASFMNGVHYAAETVMDLETLVYGLENILD
ncbi:4-hydroxy-tetrahydrodipicolinate reductase [Sporolactobacillus inulinus]|jgi:4-hydroxy-tetrahydrodipicolinate reductase|uniref:4-hydroxy-tetrahydrodipicolinate reductase n=1 Tax=Sporolactobacillus inulinus CASD TaxID=1069536 RepID=A0A0U1QSP9_9BACL|nr:4-hydroxy-tetrahydrodipicolinate reductase [Sporolactobacillus inulinus]KLI03823.1 dihydrodipicolinate reductase [Sporolactobacillus inulinus CASD]GEB76095.1 4-hydroxy-tetrahydrodipicolinate reductase [Sporolactobacillus inulinus]